MDYNQLFLIFQLLNVGVITAQLTSLSLPDILAAMVTGSIVEYIDQQKIISAVILQEKNGKVRLLNEFNREVSFSGNRLSHISQTKLDTGLSRESLVSQLKELTENRKNLSKDVNIRELWEILHEEQVDIDLSTMTMFCFDPPLTSDHEAAVIRAFFQDRLYFKFNKTIFTPHSPEQVELKKRQILEAEKRERQIQMGTKWINDIVSMESGSLPNEEPSIINILKSYYLFGNDADNALLAHKMVQKSSLSSSDHLFDVFVKAGIWDEDENIALLSMNIPDSFSDEVLDKTQEIVKNPVSFIDDSLREDLTTLPLITIDGQSTLDFDDAISLENTDTGYRLGIHIVDVDAYIKSGDTIDLSARERANSIYMPDARLPMLPQQLSDDLCSLKQGELRPAVSTLINMSRFFEIQDYRIIPSIIKVHQQMSYTEANLLTGKDDPITTLHKIATVQREKRLNAGAVQITLPEVNIWLEENKEIGYSRIDREMSSRMLISEFMILANSLMAEFLKKHDMPAVFRSQAEPKQRLFKGLETSLLMNMMQKRQLFRAVIGTKPEPHSGLAVKAYVTATSPIRRYYDLLTQRQLKAILGFHEPYTKTELDDILMSISMAVTASNRVQALRKRYWIIKYLEAMKGATFEALVLERHRDQYLILIKELMLEAKLQVGAIRLQNGDVIRVTVQHADARRNLLSFCL